MAVLVRLTVVAIVVDMFFGTVFGFWSTNHFALYACQISKILSNIDKPEKPFVANPIDFMSITGQKSLVLYTICFQFNLEREKEGRRQKDQQNSEL